MKFRIRLRVEDAKPGFAGCSETVNGGEEWWEDYDEDIEDAPVWAKVTVDRFNASLRPREKRRTLLKVEVISESNAKFHKWVKRTNGMSVEFRGRVADLMYCDTCRITGKRFGLSSTVTIDSKFRKKGFRNCDTARELLERL